MKQEQYEKAFSLKCQMANYRDYIKYLNEMIRDNNEETFLDVHINGYGQTMIENPEAYCLLKDWAEQKLDELQKEFDEL